MKSVGLQTIARKELRSYFLSPVALIFLGLFLVVTLFYFFYYAKFFSRNLADVRPLFQSLPFLLIFLVAAVTMRQWSEEQKMGTLEILLTLPVRTRDLVLGKFVAGMALVALALGLTLPLPIVVDLLGTLDWGPVIGGYVAAFLLASTYMSVGLCVSSRTDNQIVALMVTCVIGAVLYALGSDTIAGFFGNNGAEVMRSLGTGSRFLSIERGVLDVRDLFYYGSLSAFFLLLNGLFVDQKRTHHDDDTLKVLTAARSSVLLAVVTGLALLAVIQLVPEKTVDGEAKLLARLVVVALVALFAILTLPVRLFQNANPRVSRAGGLQLLALLAALNVVAGNAWLAPVTALRADLTSGGDYSISHVTEELLESLAEPLTISGYFSEKTHPLLAPLVPRIRDFLKEYQIRGGGKVTVEYADPNMDPDLEEELNQQYSIKTFPFRITGRHEDSVVNSYFHLLIKYGDEYQVLSFDDLIEINAGESDVEVRLKNIEYDLTRAIKKVAHGFQSIDAVFAAAATPARLTAFISVEKLPEEFKDAPDRVRKISKDLADKSGGKFVFEEKDPSKDQALAQEINQKYGFRPLATDLFAKDQFYMHLLFQSGDKLESVFPQGDVSEAAIRTNIEAAIKRATPGFLKTVALLSEEPKQEQPNPMMPPQFQQPKAQADYRAVQQAFAEDLTVKREDLKSGFVPQDVDVLIVAKPGKLDDKQLYAIDQYLMRGGAVVALAGAYTVKADREGISAVKQDEGLSKLLQAYGVTIEDGFVMDEQNAKFPMPVQERRGQFVMQRIEMMSYPFFPDVRPDTFLEGHMALAGVPGIAMTWASPLKLAEGLKPDEVKAEVLFTSSDKSWLRKDSNIEPRKDEPNMGFSKTEGEYAAFPLAVSVVGRMKSYFADKASPLFEADAEAGEGADRTGRTLKESTPDARLVVVGSSEFASDLVTQLANQAGGGPFRGNLMLVRNLVDWSTEDTDLLQIRSAGAFSRTLEPRTPDEMTRWEIGTYAATLALLSGIVATLSTRRRRAVPITLSPEVRA